MMEMACVSFNKVRLHYYVQQGDARAQKLHYLLHHPFRLFGTTLIGVNVAMVISSECAREFHSALGLSPDLAPLSQVVLVVIFGELAPMFAARHYAENVAMIGIPYIYTTARLLTPVLWVIGWVSKLMNYLSQNKSEKVNIFLSQEELQKILEEHEEEPIQSQSHEMNLITQNIFQLKHKSAKNIMIPLHAIPRLPSNATVGQMKKLVKQTNADFVLIYYKDYKQIVGTAFPRDYLRILDSKRARDYTRQPWFITETTPLTKILQQFQRNNQSVAIILDKQGQASGLITLNDLLSKIFGDAQTPRSKEQISLILERTLSGGLTVEKFNRQFSVHLDEDPFLTLSEVMIKNLGRLPEKNEVVIIGSFEIKAKELSLSDVKKITIKTKTF